MILDNLLMFTGTSNGASAGITSTANGDAPTTGTQAASNVLDLGVTSGIPSSGSGGGARDIGIGDAPMMKLLAQVITAFTVGTTLQLQLQGCIDNGSGGVGTATTMWTSAAYAEAVLLAGAQIANVDVPRTVPGQAVPRFLKLNFITVGTHSTGVIECCIVLDRFDQIGSITGTLSGYPAGINVAN